MVTYHELLDAGLAPARVISSLQSQDLINQQFSLLAAGTDLSCARNTRIGELQPRLHLPSYDISRSLFCHLKNTLSLEGGLHVSSQL